MRGVVSPATVWFTSAPNSTRGFTHSRCPSLTTVTRGASFTSAPWCSNRFMHFTCLDFTAVIRRTYFIHLCWVGFTSAPFSMRYFKQSTCPLTTAASIGSHFTFQSAPLLSLFTSAPWVSTSNFTVSRSPISVAQYNNILTAKATFTWDSASADAVAPLLSPAPALCVVVSAWRNPSRKPVTSSLPPSWRRLFSRFLLVWSCVHLRYLSTHPFISPTRSVAILSGVQSPGSQMGTTREKTHNPHTDNWRLWNQPLTCLVPSKVKIQFFKLPVWNVEILLRGLICSQWKTKPDQILFETLYVLRSQWVFPFWEGELSGGRVERSSSFAYKVSKCCWCQCVAFHHGNLVRVRYPGRGTALECCCQMRSLNQRTRV